jgi:hypothetical protein
MLYINKQTYIIIVSTSDIIGEFSTPMLYCFHLRYLGVTNLLYFLIRISFEIKLHKASLWVKAKLHRHNKSYTFTSEHSVGCFELHSLPIRRPGFPDP